MPASYANVDAYMNSLDGSRQADLQQLRRIIRETVPEAEEIIQYNMPYSERDALPCIYPP